MTPDYPFYVLYFSPDERKMRYSIHCLLYMAGGPVFADTWKYVQMGVGKGLGGRIRREKESEKDVLLVAGPQLKPSANEKQVLQRLA